MTKDRPKHLRISIPVEVLTQAVPVAVVVIEPVVVDAASAQSSETTVDSGIDVMEASPVSISGTATADSSVPAATSPQLKANTKGAQEVESHSGKDFAAKPDAIQASQPDGDQRSISSASAIDPKIQQADFETTGRHRGSIQCLAKQFHNQNRSRKRSNKL